MSLDSITGDDFDLLDAETHADALLLYEEAIATCTSQAASYRGVAGTHESLSECLDKLTSYLQLRKLHKARLQELAGEQESALPLASERYHQNALAAVQ